jgi:hypothetical protein
VTAQHDAGSGWQCRAPTYTSLTPLYAALFFLSMGSKRSHGHQEQNQDQQQQRTSPMLLLIM